MNIIKNKKNEKNTGNRLPTPDKVKKGFRWYCSLVAAVALMGCCTMTALAAPAAGGDPLTVINNLSDDVCCKRCISNASNTTYSQLICGRMI